MDESTNIRPEGASTDVSANGSGGESGASAPSWFYADGIAGVGERPEFFDSKYKTLAEQAKGYKELEKKLGSFAHNAAPDNYDLGEFSEIFSADDPNIQGLLGYSKEAKLTQDAFGKITGHIGQFLKSKLPDPETEKARLGPNAQERIDRIETWLTNHGSEKISELAGKLAYSADFFELMDEIRIKQGGNAMNPPNAGSDATPSGNAMARQDSMKQVHADMLLNKIRYEKDPGYRDEISERIKKLHPDD